MIGRWIEALLGRFGYIKLTEYRRALLERAPTALPPAPVSVRPAAPQHYAPMTLPVVEPIPQPAPRRSVRLGSPQPSRGRSLQAATAMRLRSVEARGSSHDWRRTAPEAEGRTTVFSSRRYRR